MPRGTATRTLVGLLAGIGLVSCSSGSATLDRAVPPPIEASTPTSDGPATGSPVDSGGARADGLDGASARQIWLDFWTAASASDPTAALAGLDGELAELTGVTLDRLPADFAGARLSQAPTVSNSSPFRFEDCIAAETATSSTAGLLFAGELMPETGSWTLTVEGPGPPCAPAAAADDILATYLEFARIDQQWWDPPDPDDPAIAERTTGQHRQHLETVLADLKQQGAHAVLYSPEVDRQPEVVGWFGDRVVVRDCYDRFEGLGVFDAAGNPVSRYPAGGSVLDRITFVKEDNRWKVTEIASSVGVDCVRKPSGEAVQLVGS